MEYSLQKLNKNLDLGILTNTSLIDQLNLIGFEIDDIFNQEDLENSFLTNTKLLLKIPANREDLLVEKIFLTEISAIFLIEIYKLWKKIRNKYYVLLNKKYLEFNNYQIFPIKSEINEILIYNIQIKNFQKNVSPKWIQKKLLNFGVEPKKNFEDVLNLVKFEWGQEYNFVFFNETFNNSFQYILKKNYEKESKKNDIILEYDERKILNIFDITKNKNNDEDTNNGLLLQFVYYDIHKNNLGLNSINTNCSLKKLRKTFVENFKYSSQRILTLLEIIYSISISSKIYSNIKNKPVELKLNRILKLKKETLEKVLNIKKISLNVFKTSGLKIICKTSEEIYLDIPPFRNDLNREIDLIEEYSRFIGYKNFEHIFPKKLLSYSKQKKDNINFIKQYFLINGFTELLTSSLDDNKNKDLFSINLENPLNNEFGLLRTNLISKIIEIFEKNLRIGNKPNNFFEIGRVFKKENSKLIEIEKIGGIFQLQIFKNQRKSSTDWFIAKGFLENFLKNFGYCDSDIDELKIDNLYFHPKKSIIIKDKNKKIIGIFGEINPKLKSLFNLKNSTYIFELELNQFVSWKMNSIIKLYKDSSKYPSIIKDFSFLVTRNVNFFEIKTLIQKNCTNLKNIEFFDIYFNPNLQSEVTIGIRLEFQSFNETLTNEQIDEKSKSIQLLLKNNFNMELKI
jgi:phenylalanyl-tRNA synthetase beta chain